MNAFIVAIIVCTAFCLTGCAEHIPSSQLPGDTAGFFTGIWHGWIAVWTILFSLFDDSIAVYAANNIGFGYNFGFGWGIGLFAAAFK